MCAHLEEFRDVSHPGLFLIPERNQSQDPMTKTVPSLLNSPFHTKSKPENSFDFNCSSATEFNPLNPCQIASFP